jgi:glycosyltransferase involved in cell wall biosynthesis
VYIIDSYSTDRTLDIAREYPNVKIFQNKWINYATQFNWALDNVPIKTKWVLRLDADEYLTEELKAELQDKIPTLEEKYTGIVMPLQRVFLGRNINHGIAKGIKMMRIFQNGKARSEIRQMDEHLELLEGVAVEFTNAFADDNLNNIGWWVQKHVGYARREAVDLLDIEFNLTGSSMHTQVSGISQQALSKRKMKERYARKPLFLRSFIYFVYRYIYKLGFLDGKEGFIWDFMQGWWYRTLVDVHIFEVKKACGNDKEKIRKYIKDNYGIAL